jgi:AAA+ superfamily predicted ATPase
MIIAATNHAFIIDPAMGRRFQDRICISLPDSATRTKLLEYYISHIFFDEKQTSAHGVLAAKALFTPQLITELAEKTAGLSPSEIADMIETMRNKAELNNRSLIAEDINSAIDEAIEKHRENIKVIDKSKQ